MSDIGTVSLKLTIMGTDTGYGHQISVLDIEYLNSHIKEEILHAIRSDRFYVVDNEFELSTALKKAIR